MVINGGATSSGEQDNEDTELMAIYTTENGIAEKVPMFAPSYCLTRVSAGPRMPLVWDSVALCEGVVLCVCFVMKES